MNKEPEDYRRIYIITDYRTDIKHIGSALGIKKHLSLQEREETSVKHLYARPESWRGYHFGENDLVILGRAKKGPISRITNLMNHIKHYTPKNETPEIIHETG